MNLFQGWTASFTVLSFPVLIPVQLSSHWLFAGFIVQQFIGYVLGADISLPLVAMYKERVSKLGAFHSNRTKPFRKVYTSTEVFINYPCLDYKYLLSAVPVHD